MTKFKIKTALLEALTKFCARWDDPRPWLASLFVTPERIIATDGCHMVIMPIVATSLMGVSSVEFKRIGGNIAEPFLLPGALVHAAAASARALWDVLTEDEFGDEFPASFELNSDIEVTVRDRRVELADAAHPEIVLSSPLHPVSDFPPVSKLEELLGQDGGPRMPMFDPALLAHATGVTRATRDGRGLWLHAWADGDHGPVEFRSDAGTRFILMGMSVTGAKGASA